MASTQTKQARYAKKLAEKDHRRVSVWLAPEDWKRLDRLSNSGTEKAKTIAKALFMMEKGT